MYVEADLDKKYLKSIVHPKTVFASILGNLVKVPVSIFYRTFIKEKIQSPSNQFFLLDKLYVGKGLGCQLDGLKCLQLCQLG